MARIIYRFRTFPVFSAGPCCPPFDCGKKARITVRARIRPGAPGPAVFWARITYRFRLFSGFQFRAVCSSLGLPQKSPDYRPGANPAGPVRAGCFFGAHYPPVPAFFRFSVPDRVVLPLTAEKRSPDYRPGAHPAGRARAGCFFGAHYLPVRAFFRLSAPGRVLLPWTAAKKPG